MIASRYRKVLILMSLKWKEIKFQITDSLKRTKSYSFRERAETIIASQYGQMWIITQKHCLKPMYY